MLEAITILIIAIIIAVVSFILGGNRAERKAILKAQEIVEEVERKASLIDLETEKRIDEINFKLTADLALPWKEKIKKYVRS